MSTIEHAAHVIHNTDPVPMLAAAVALLSPGTVLQAAAVGIAAGSFWWTVYRDRRNWEMQAQKEQRTR